MATLSERIQATENALEWLENRPATINNIYRLMEVVLRNQKSLLEVQEIIADHSE